MIIMLLIGIALGYGIGLCFGEEGMLERIKSWTTTISKKWRR